MKVFLKFFADEFTRDLIDRWFTYLDKLEQDDLDRLAAQGGLLNKLAGWIQERLAFSGMLALILAVVAPFCIVAFTQGPWRPWLALLYALYPLPVVFCWSNLAGRRVRLKYRYTRGELFVGDQIGRISPFERARFKASLRDAEDHYADVRWILAPSFGLIAGYLITHYEVWSVAVLFFEHDFRLLWLVHRSDLAGVIVVVVLSVFYFLTAVLPVAWLKRRKLDLESWQDLEDASEQD